MIPSARAAQGAHLNTVESESINANIYENHQLKQLIFRTFKSLPAWVLIGFSILNDGDTGHCLCLDMIWVYKAKPGFE